MDQAHGKGSPAVLALGVIGAVIIIASVAMTWLSLDATFADGSTGTAGLSGLDLMSDSSGIYGIPGAAAPFIYIIGAVAVLVYTISHYFRPDVHNEFSLNAVYVILAAMFLIGLGTSIDSGLVVTNPPIEGINVDTQVPVWVSDLFGQEISRVSVSGGSAKYVGFVGLLIAWFGTAFLSRRKAVEQ